MAKFEFVCLVTTALALMLQVKVAHSVACSSPAVDGKIRLTFDMCDARRRIGRHTTGGNDYRRRRIVSMIYKINESQLNRHKSQFRDSYRLCNCCVTALEDTHIHDILTLTSFSDLENHSVRQYVQLSKVAMILEMITLPSFADACNLPAMPIQVRNLRRVLNDWRILDPVGYHEIQNGGCMLTGYFNQEDMTCDNLRDLVYVVLNDSERTLKQTKCFLQLLQTQ